MRTRVDGARQRTRGRRITRKAPLLGAQELDVHGRGEGSLSALERWVRRCGVPAHEVGVPDQGIHLRWRGAEIRARGEMIARAVDMARARRGARGRARLLELETRGRDAEVGIVARRRLCE